MEKILCIEMMVMNLLVLFIVWSSDTYRVRGPVLFSQRLFHFSLWLHTAAIFFGILIVVVEGTAFVFSHFLFEVSIFLCDILHTFVTLFLMLYADHELYPDTERFRKRLPFYTFPAVINTILGVCSLQTKCSLYIDENHLYRQGMHSYASAMISLGYGAYLLGILMKYKREQTAEDTIQKELYDRLMMIPVCIGIGFLEKLLLPTGGWRYMFTTLAILWNFIMMQNGSMARDHLTGLYNRSRLEGFMNNQLKHLKEGNYCFLILIDLDKFKEINDTFGHIVGDDALVDTAKLLRTSCKQKSDYIARLGGDEFVVIGQCQAMDTVDRIIERMHHAADSFNHLHERPYEIHFSAGYALSDGSEPMTLDMLINEADHNMYDVKRKKL